ncbi:MAG: hypothetical protein ACPLYC_01390 [Minisyncoccia bacterium]
MTKIEIIWREILYQVIEKKVGQFTQKALAQKFSISLNLVFQALKIPRQAKAIEVTSRGFRIRDKEKFLYLWATRRNLSKDIIYQTHSELSVKELEASMPPDIIYAAYSAYLKYFKEAPADYDKVYVYLEEENLKKIQKRFPPAKGYENLIILKADPWLKNYGPLTPLPQLFVDLWNLEDWYAKDFLNALKEKIL